MPAVSTIIAGIGLGVAAFGAYENFESTQKMAKASDKAEKLRQQQMNLDATRKRREVIRQMILQRAAGQANAAVQGASQGDTAVVGAGYQQTSSAGQNVTAINQSQEIGAGIFKANSDYAAGQVTGAWGQAAGQLGGGLMKNSETIARVGAAAGLWAV